MSSPSQGSEPSERPQSGLPGSLNSRYSGGTVRPYSERYQYAENQANPLPELVFEEPASSPSRLAASAADQHDGTVSEFPETPDSIGMNGRRNGNLASVYAPSAHRLSAFAPSRPNPFDANTNSTATAGAGAAAAAAAAKEEIEPDTTFAEPDYPWYRWDKKPPRMRWFVGLLTILGIAAVLLAILGAMGILTPSRNGTTTSAAASVSSSAAPPSSSTSGSSIPASSSTTSSTSSQSSSTTATATPLSTVCPDSSTWIQNVTSVGVWGETTGWSQQYVSGSTAQLCCNSCYASTKGCTAWLFNPDTTYTPCALITYSNGTSTNSRCPNGFVAAASYTSGGTYTAGFGPCSLQGWGN